MFELEKNIEVLRLFQYFFSSISDVFFQRNDFPVCHADEARQNPFLDKTSSFSFCLCFSTGGKNDTGKL